MCGCDCVCVCVCVCALVRGLEEELGGVCGSGFLLNGAVREGVEA